MESIDLFEDSDTTIADQQKAHDAPTAQDEDKENADFSDGSGDEYVPSDHSKDTDCSDGEEALTIASVQYDSSSFTRKRSVNKSNWCTESRKAKRQRGESYETKKGKVVSSRSPKPI